MKKILLTIMILAMGISQAEIKQNLGVDQSVDYASLETLGPWDDRNYQITKDDLSYLPADDQYLANVPLFFKIKMRKDNPPFGKFYPRSTLQGFQIQYGGILKDGIWYKEGLGIGYHGENTYGKPTEEAIRATAENETPLQTGVSGNEVAIECNPTNGDICVAGSNGSGGQRMYYSTDAGATWTLSQVNSNSCCDPTIDWSSDGSIVYQADLSGSIGVRWSRSLDQGVTWENMKVLTNSGSDKEWIHVDRSPTSPHKDNVYLTYHNGNTMQFARSTDMGLTMQSPISFGGETSGIGSDITTDPDGNIYYVYASLSSAQGIKMLKSTNGGVSFEPGVTVSPLNGTFDFAIPAMETRRAFIYAATDVDVNTGDIYVTWTDEADDSVGSNAANSHGWIQVAKSSDEGATWQMCAQPHDTTDTLAGGSTTADDMSPVDRFHPWLKVGENGVVHIVYYDTRHSNNRTGVDLFYTNSVDGCATWAPEERYTTVTSNNISNGQEWGDYNGLSVVLDRIAASLTDNRPGQGQTALIVSGENPSSSEGFSLSSDPSDLAVCQDTSYLFEITVDSTPGFAEDVTLSFVNVPSFVENENLFPTVVPAPGTSDLTFDVMTGGTPGVELISIQGVGLDVNAIADMIFDNGFETTSNVVTPFITNTFDISLNYSTETPPATMLTSPMNAEVGVSGSSVVYEWDAVAEATGYIFELATDMAFVNILETANVATNTYTSGVAIPSTTTVYWRVTTTNACGVGTVSETFSFTTSTEICFTTVTPIPDDSEIQVTLPVADMGTIASLTVSFQSGHTWPGDLIVDLSHLKTSVNLMNRVGTGGFGCGTDGVDVVFDDTSNTPIDTVCNGTSPGVSGTAAPEGLLSTFAGLELAGDWVLTVSDNAGLDTGNIEQFCLIPVLEVE